MNSPEEYLKRTESAVIKIFDGINSYLKILRDALPPVYVGNFGDTQNQRLVYKNWVASNRAAIQSSLEAQREFSAESFALATLCGSLLQIAAMGIQWFSENKEIPEDVPEDLRLLIKTGTKTAKFCIGRRIRSVPIGLAIYAARNQFNHMDDEELREPNITIFNLLAYNHGVAVEQCFKDPAFDLENKVLINFSSNITALLEWRNYESYHSDMHSLIVAG
ncbi:hypothetical protein [Fischerella sp. PCC 9605]|uniref:hypothetical protein n=1 Tax=Fischerella sp. PCC 9605 TaxID=1173024 RepID=UPI00047D7EEE|nr:hypothetical protein [Fischerella sp. PCC 9605]